MQQLSWCDFTRPSCNHGGRDEVRARVREEVLGDFFSLSLGQGFWSLGPEVWGVDSCLGWVVFVWLVKWGMGTGSR